MPAANARWHRAELRVQQFEEELRILAIAKQGPRSESMSSNYLDRFVDETGMMLDDVAADPGREPLTEPMAIPARACAVSRPGGPARSISSPDVHECGLSAQYTCSRRDAPTAVIGHDESQRLDVEPLKFFLQVARREKRAYDPCMPAGLVTAPVPVLIEEKGSASDRPQIQTVVATYGDRTPLCRQSAILSRDAGLEIG